MAKLNKVTTNGSTYELQDYELSNSLSNISGIVKSSEGILSEAIAGVDYDYPVLTGKGVPQEVGLTGQHYIDIDATKAPFEYVYINSAEGWKPVGAGGGTIIIADEYDESSTYEIGDVVIYDEGLYRCTTMISSPEVWTSNHWSTTTVDKLIVNLQETEENLIKDLQEIKVDKTTTINGKALFSDIVLSSTDIMMADNTTIEASMTSLKTSVSEGKALIAAAVTDKGVETAANSSFSTIVTNIDNISKNCTATPLTILQGYTALAGGEIITGQLQKVTIGTVTMKESMSSYIYTCPELYGKTNFIVTLTSSPAIEFEDYYFSVKQLISLFCLDGVHHMLYISTGSTASDDKKVKAFYEEVVLNIDSDGTITTQEWNGPESMCWINGGIYTYYYW